jgi:hypothetical protein
LIGTYIQKKQNQDFKGNRTLTFIAALFTVAKMWKNPKCPYIAHDWIKETRYAYAFEYYSALKKKASYFL